MNRDPEHNGVLQTCEALGIGFVPWGPVGMGYLTGTLNAQSHFDANADLRADFDRFSPENLAANQPFLHLLRKIAAEKMPRLRRLPLHGCWRRNPGLCRFRVPETSIISMKI